MASTTMALGDLMATQSGLAPEFDVFISYAHADNTTGWVTGLRDAILSEFQPLGRPVNLFFDTEAIRDQDDWEHRIETGLLHFPFPTKTRELPSRTD